MRVILETLRLRLRPLAAGDLMRLHDLHNDPLVVAALYEGKPPSWAETHTRLNQFLTDWSMHGFGFFAVFAHDGNSREGTFLGRRGLRFLPDSDDLELGACFYHVASGKEYGPEAGCAVLDFAFTALKASRVLCVVRPENQRSLRSVGKMGFRQIDDRWCYGRLMRCFEVTEQDLNRAIAANPRFAPMRIFTQP
ncbi:GNAT family N-acetyltransferase [Sinorhizobium meliloti]|nr:GNAT family N-acetyltransferase [Sinorhizobium meliloti]